MTYKMQLKRGAKVEREHKNTYLFLKRNVASTGKLPSEDKVYTSIANDHIKEFPNGDYYKELAKMEKKLEHGKKRM